MSLPRIYANRRLHKRAVTTHVLSSKKVRYSLIICTFNLVSWLVPVDSLAITYLSHGLAGEEFIKQQSFQLITPHVPALSVQVGQVYRLGVLHSSANILEMLPRGDVSGSLVMDPQRE